MTRTSGGSIAALWLTLMLVVSGCATGRNYSALNGPEYGGNAFQPSGCDPLQEELRVVTFNVEFGIDAAGAADLLASHPDLRCATIVLLQEMDEEGTRWIADRLGMAWAYFPAVFHFRHDRDFGNAVLSRRPIVAKDKLVLPHVSVPTRTQRTATAVTLRFAEDSVRVYSTHLGSVAEIGPGAREEQLETILEDAGPFEHVIVGGDLNSGSVGEVARRAGYDWLTDEGTPTVSRFRWDHLLVRGLSTFESHGTGTVSDAGDVSDHRPVWIRVRPPDA